MGDNPPTPRVLLADRGYDADSIRKSMDKRDVLPVIPRRRSRKMRVGVDWSLYRLSNLFERFFKKVKNAQRVATRYDKPAKSFFDFTSSRLWQCHLSIGPYRGLRTGDGVDAAAPRATSQCAELAVSTHKLKERAPMREITIIGVNLAKNVFEGDRPGADGSVLSREKLSRPRFVASRD